MIRTERGKTEIRVPAVSPDVLEIDDLKMVSILNKMTAKIEITADLTCILATLIKRFDKHTAVEMWAQACKNIDEVNKREKENNKDE